MASNYVLQQKGELYKCRIDIEIYDLKAVCADDDKVALEFNGARLSSITWYDL